MTLVAGIDGYPRGWVAIVLENGVYQDALVAPSLAVLVERLAAVEVVKPALAGLGAAIVLPNSPDARRFSSTTDGGSRRA